VNTYVIVMANKYSIIFALLFISAILIVTWFISVRSVVPRTSPPTRCQILSQQLHPGFTSKREESQQVSLKRPLNVIFQFENNGNVGDGGTIFESDWIVRFVFGPHLGRPVQVLERGCLANDSVYVFLFHPGELFHQLRDGKFVNFGSYLMGDERATMETASYENLTAFAFRNYWFEPHRGGAQFVPLGVKSGLNFPEEPVFLPASKRAYLCNFIGTAVGRNERTHMFNVLKDELKSKCYIKKEGSWPTNAKGLHALVYRDILYDSKFTLAPFGNNPESLRFYEALESGSIPITTYAKASPQDGWTGDDFIYGGLVYASGAAYRNHTPGTHAPFDFQYRDVPIPRVKDWEEANALIEHYERNAKEMDALQARIVEWWGGVKKKIQERIRKTIDSAFERQYGPGA
jgi:hypothetical protein